MTPNARHAGPVDPQADERALNDRQAAILEAVVTEYIGSAEPVGSSHVASAPGVQVSSATVRSEMVALERDGYLVQPHTSAGRIPTDKGYRFFVDHLTAARGPRADPAQAGLLLLRPGPRGDGGHARAGHRPAVRAHLLCRRGGRALARLGDDPLGPGRGPGPPRRPAGGRPVRRRRREADDRPRARRRSLRRQR